MGISSALGSSALLPAGLGFRNLLINGGMQIAQRGTSFTYGTGAGAFYYGADRWKTSDYTWSSGSNITVSNDSTVYPTGFSNSYKVATGATGLTFASGGYLAVETSVEGYTSTTVYGKSAYLSFWVRSSVTGVYNVLLENASWGASTTTRIYTPEYTINVANTWEYKTIPINFADAVASGTWDRTNGKGIGLSFVLGAHSTRTGDPYKTGWTTFSSYAGIKTSSAVNWATNANATFYLTGVQLEANVQPTPFEQRPIGVELALCQRYYEKTYEQSVVPGANQSSFPTIINVPFSTAFGQTDGWGCSRMNFKVVKRASPVVTVYNTDGTANQLVTLVGSSLTGAVVSNPVIYANDQGFTPNIGNHTNGVAVKVAFHYVASAEL